MASKEDHGKTWTNGVMMTLIQLWFDNNIRKEFEKGTITNLSLNSNRNFHQMIQLYVDSKWDGLEAISCKQNFKFRSAYFRLI